VRALDDHVKVVGIDVHVVFFSIIANGETDFFFHVGGNSVFGGVHVGDLRMDQAFCEFLPRPVGNIVVFSNIHTPNFARWLLEDS